MAGLPERPRADSAQSWPWQAVCDQAIGPLALLDVHGRYCYVNHALCHLLGYERSELVGRTTRDITPDGASRKCCGNARSTTPPTGWSYSISKAASPASTTPSASCWATTGTSCWA